LIEKSGHQNSSYKSAIKQQLKQNNLTKKKQLAKKNDQTIQQSTLAPKM